VASDEAPVLTVLRTAVAPPTDEDPPTLVLVVDDSADDALTSAIAEEGMVPSERFGGAWAASVTVREGYPRTDAATFLLIEREGGMERRLELSDWIAEHLDVAVRGEHFVAILPEEFADVDVLDIMALGGALFVEVEPSPSVAKLLQSRRAG
jgi:hypothetical protein